MTESLLANKVVTLPQVGLFADGAAVKTVGTETFRICSQLVDEVPSWKAFSTYIHTYIQYIHKYLHMNALDDHSENRRNLRSYQTRIQRHPMHP